MRRGLSFGQFLRLRRICHSTEEFNLQAQDLSNRLEQRGYPQGVIKKAWKRARYIHRDWLLDPQYTNTTSVSEDFITGILPFMERSSTVLQILRSRWSLLRVMECFNKPLRVAFSRGRNLGDILMKTPLSIDRSHRPLVTVGHSPCGSCSFCATTLSGVEWQHPQTFRSYQRHWDTSCQSTHVVYKLLCPCALIYIGRTIRPVRIRLSEHASRLRQKTLTAPIVQHCLDKGHCFADLHWTVIDQIPVDPRGGDREKKLQRQEQQWIFKLSSVEPKGLNQEIEWRSVL